jgi:hypothetical protein
MGKYCSEPYISKNQAGIKNSVFCWKALRPLMPDTKGGLLLNE